MSGGSDGTINRIQIDFAVGIKPDVVEPSAHSGPFWNLDFPGRNAILQQDDQFMKIISVHPLIFIGARLESNTDWAIGFLH